MALAKHFLVAACAGLCLTICLPGDAWAKKGLHPETAQERLRADQYGQKAFSLMLDRKASQAIGMLDVLIKQNPQSASLYTWRARIQVEAVFDRSMQYDQKLAIHNAERDLAKALTLDDTVSNIYLVRARLAIFDQLEDKALLDLNKSIELDGKNVSAHLWRAQLLEGEGKAKEALKDLDAAVNVLPGSDTLSRRALVRRHVLDFKGSIEDYNSAYKMEPAQFLLVKRGEAYELAKQYDKAILDCRAAIKTNMKATDEISCRKRIARMYLAMNKPDLAAKELDVVLKMNPEDLASIGKHLECTKKLKDWKAALSDVNKLLDFESRYDGYYKERAEIYRALGNANAAAADEAKYKELHKKTEAPLQYQ